MERGSGAVCSHTSHSKGLVTKPEELEDDFLTTVHAFEHLKATNIHSNTQRK